MMPRTRDRGDADHGPAAQVLAGVAGANSRGLRRGGVLVSRGLRPDDLEQRLQSGAGLLNSSKVQGPR